MNKVDEFIRDVKKITNPPVVDFDKHVPTDNELNNLTHLSFRFILGLPTFRACDFMMVKMMAGKVESVRQLDKKFIPALADYMWDHMMGEPDELSEEDVEKMVKALRDQLYGQDEKTRNCIEAVPA